jgi:PAT family beta-lactamase induction signal transducer AmpG
MLTALFYGEPERHRRVASKPGFGNAAAAVWRPFVEFFERKGALLVLLFILLHKIGDTLANLTFRLLFDDLGFTNDEIALYDVGVGFWAYLIGIFIGGVCVVAYFSALCDLRFTAAQYALISAAASIVGRFLTGTTAGALIDAIGYVNFYLLTTAAALPGILLFWIMMRAGLIDQSIGSAGTVGSGDVRAEHPAEPAAKPTQSGG